MISNFYNSIYAKEKHFRLRLTKFSKQVILELANQVQLPTYKDVRKRLGCDEIKAKQILKSIKTKRKQLSIAQKIAGVNVKLPGLQNDTKEGFVYLIENVAFPGWIKGGMATDCNKRLSTYNFHDPESGFQFVAFKKVANRRKIERHLLKSLKVIAKSSKGEWFKIDKTDCLHLFDQVIKTEMAHPVSVDCKIHS